MEKDTKKTKKKENKKVVEIHIYIHQVPVFQYPQQPNIPQWPTMPLPNTTGPTPPYNPTYYTTC